MRTIYSKLTKAHQVIMNVSNKTLSQNKLTLKGVKTNTITYGKISNLVNTKDCVSLYQKKS